MSLNLQALHPSRFKEARHLLIKHLPALTAARDVQSALQKRNVPGIIQVAPLYRRYRPMDSALVALASPNHLTEAMLLLKQFDITGIEVEVERMIPPQEWDLSVRRSRGHQGRKEASSRGIMDGNGPWAGLGGASTAQKAVVLAGFPGTTPVSMVEKFLEGYGVAEAKEEKMIYKVPLPPNSNTLYSKFLVITKTKEDALTVYRELNQTLFPGRKQHSVQAQLVY